MILQIVFLKLPQVFEILVVETFLGTYLALFMLLLEVFMELLVPIVIIFAKMAPWMSFQIRFGVSVPHMFAQFWWSVGYLLRNENRSVIKANVAC